LDSNLYKIEFNPTGIKAVVEIDVKLPPVKNHLVEKSSPDSAPAIILA